MSASRAAGVVLAGGLGTRMRPLTASTPKPLLPVGGKPVVVHQLRMLAEIGVREVVVATSYRAADFAVLDPVAEDLGLQLRCSVEEEPLGTGGALGAALGALLPGDPEAPVVVLNGDLLTGHDLAAQLAVLARSPREVEVVLHVREVADARAYGSVVVGGEGVVTAFVEKSDAPPSRLVNAGTYVVRRRLGRDLGASGDAPLSLERDVLPGLVARRTVRAHVEDAYFVDVGSPAALVAASADAVLRGSPRAERPTGATAWVHPDAHVDPRAQVGAGSTVHAGARIGPEAVVTGSVVMADAVIEDGAEVERSALGPGAVVAAGARLTRCALGAGARTDERANLADALVDGPTGTR